MHVERITGSDTAATLRPEAVCDIAIQLQTALAQIVAGQTDVIRETIVALFAGGHVLLEGVPGLGKTLLVRSLAQALHLEYSRIQFTPDLMPADCTGTNIIGEDDQGRRSFRFQPGPLFANLVLADEINRATPKTQSALLEAMQERTITVGDKTRPLPAPFFVMATQNPLEMEGTYPLPEAQLDRFFFKIHVPFPDAAVLGTILKRTLEPPAALSPIVDRAQLSAIRQIALSVPVAAPVADYAIKLVLATHPGTAHGRTDSHGYIRAGASPRAMQALITGAQVLALIDGRFSAGIDDIRRLALPALRHRLLLNFEALAEGVTTDVIITRLLTEIGI